jgi:hypothetical protein
MTKAVNRAPPHSEGEVSASYADGGGSHAVFDPFVADYRATSPFEWGGTG